MLTPDPPAPSASVTTGTAEAMRLRSRRGAFLYGTPMGLAWFPLILVAFLIGNTVAGTFILGTAHSTAAQLPVFTYATDMTMLVLGLLWCLLVVPATLRVRPRAYGSSCATSAFWAAPGGRSLRSVASRPALPALPRLGLVAVQHRPAARGGRRSLLAAAGARGAGYFRALRRRDGAAGIRQT